MNTPKHRFKVNDSVLLRTGEEYETFTVAQLRGQDEFGRFLVRLSNGKIVLESRLK